MNRESFRRELQRAFDNMAGPPSSSLPDRVRSALNETYQERAPIWVAGLAAALIAAIVIGVLVVIHPFNRQPLVSVGQPSPSPSPSASPSPSLPPYDCGSAYRLTSEGAPAVAEISAVRTGAHDGYDRITIEFKDGQPGSIELTPQTGATFIQDGSGQPVTLRGGYGLKVLLRGADAHTAYTGSRDLKTAYSGLLEARVVGDYEGYVTWGLGLSKPACYRAFLLTNPTRLVIDIQVT